MGHYNKKKLPNKGNNKKKTKESAAKNPVMTGRIGKPSKSHKHKKIRATAHYDPDTVFKPKQKLKSNSKPLNDKDQEVSWRLKELMNHRADLKDSNKQMKKKKPNRKDSKNQVEKGMTKPEAQIPKFKKRINESDRAFLFRIDQETHNVVAKTQMADKYKTTIEDMEDGKVAVKKKRKRSAKAKERLQKLHDKKKKNSDSLQDFSQIQGHDEVKFGEVVMQPPTLKSKPRKCESLPGNKTNTKSLLLNKLLKKPVSESGTCSTVREPGQTIKHKDMSLLQIAQHEKQREKVIEQYRAMKAQKLAAKQS